VSVIYVSTETFVVL